MKGKQVTALCEECWIAFTYIQISRTRKYCPDCANKRKVEAVKRYLKTPEGKLILKRYFQSDKAKATLQRYLKTPKGSQAFKKAMKKWNSSEKGKASKKAYYLKTKLKKETNG